MKLFYPSFVFTILAILSTSSMAKPGIEGQPAPEFRLAQWFDAEGKKLNDAIKLGDYRGRYVLLMFWQSWCPGCHKHAFPTMKAVKEHFADEQGLALLGAQTVFEGFSTNTLDQVTAVQQEYGLNFPMAHDDGEEHKLERSYLMNQYRSGGTPWMVLIDPKGIVLANAFHFSTQNLIALLEKKLASLKSKR